MRFFYCRMFKNIVLVYICLLICFAYITMMEAIPSHVYLQAGEKLSLDEKIPVQIEVCDDRKAAMADVGLSTYESISMRKGTQETVNLPIGSHDMMCYLFGIFPIKEVKVSVVESMQVYASGHVVGIYGATDGVFVLGSSPVELADGSYTEPTEHILFPGDYIVAVDHKEIMAKEELMDEVRAHGEYPMILTVRRGTETIDVSVCAAHAKGTDQNQEYSYMLGIWVKDDMAGIGTLTYYDQDGAFGALGHGIGDGETKDLLHIAQGKLYEANVLGIKKGRRGDPGELQGGVYYGSKNQIGVVDQNTDIGIYGKLNENYINENAETDTLYPLAFKQDVKAGGAVILSDASGEPAVYHIVIDSIDYSPADRNKGIRFHVDDKNLLELTGGIVQGLSGSPILQNGKLVGGVTHVLINDPTKGYGIFTETMLENDK